ncbi:MAG: hypothetical protein ACLGH4_09530 [Actinomycetes bacterium]
MLWCGQRRRRTSTRGSPRHAGRHCRRTPDRGGNIFDLSFATESRYRPFELVAPGFVTATEAAPGPGLHLAGAGPPAPFCAVEVEIDSARCTVLAGLATSDDRHVLGTYHPETRRVGIEVRSEGRTRRLRRRRVELPARFRFGVAVCENQVTVLADPGSGWQPLLTERDKVRAAVDLRRPDTLAAHRYAWGSRGDDHAGVLGVRAGLFGMTGLRDQHLVQHADGTPYVRDGKAYFTATCAGLGFFGQAHWGVFTLDLARPDRLEQVGQLFFRRDGLLLGDHAGQVVRDDDNDRWIVATSSWGDFDSAGVHVRHLTTTDDVLHGVHVLETVPTQLPTEASSWDPGITRIDGRWHVSFVESPSQKPFDFHPALAAGPQGAAWEEELELVGAATDLHQCEGPILAEVQGDWWLLASDGDHRHYPVFDLTMRRVGRLDAPYETNIPHPQLVPLESGEFLLVTFDGTQYAEKVMGYGGHGDVIIMRHRG